MKKPTKQDLLNARGKKAADVIAPGLDILFCGINPSLYTAAVGHHFARPGNRFWPALKGAGFTRCLLSPDEERELLKVGCGITNLVNFATAKADELTRGDFKKGRPTLERKVKRCRAKKLVILGLGAYRLAFNKPKAKLGCQPEKIGTTQIWVLPNPSGLNANYQLKDFVRMFKELKEG